MPPASFLVCTLVSRGDPAAPGQGHELLLSVSPERRSQGEVYSPAQLGFALHETVDVPSSSSSAQLDAAARAASVQSIKSQLLLNAGQDLRFIRSSKRIRWTPELYLECFLWRMSESYERGLDLEFAAAAQPGGPEDEGQEGQADPDQDERDKAMYRVVERRLGRASHAWEAFEAVERDASRMKNEHLSFAFHSVILPPLLDETLHLLVSLPHLAHYDAAELALNCFVQLVQQRAGQQAFRGSWPAHVSRPDGETLELPEEVVKDRLFRYWVDVVAHHFGSVSQPLAPTLSALFLRILLPLRPLALAPSSTTSLGAFITSASSAALAEMTRLRLAAATLEKLGVAKILERAARDKRPILHVIAAGNEPSVWGVLRELVHYVETIAAHPYGSLNPHIQAMTHAAEVEWASRPNILRLTLLESRPLCTGAVLASRLWDVSRSARLRAEQLRGLATSYDNPLRHHPLSPGLTKPTLPSGLRGRILRGLGLEEAREDEAAAALGETYGALDSLLKRAESGVHGEPPPAGLGGTRVQIHAAADNAVASVLKRVKDKGEGPAIVLIGAEAILPGKGGDVVAATGSWMLAEMAKKLGAKVYVVALSDHILPSTAAAPAVHQHDPTELLAGWAGTLAAELEQLDPFAVAAAKPSGDVGVETAASEVVPGTLIDGYLTEKGFLSATGCDALGRERAVAEQQLFDE